jgi:hypothetical protein
MCRDGVGTTGERRRRVVAIPPTLPVRGPLRRLCALRLEIKSHGDFRRSGKHEDANIARDGDANLIEQIGVTKQRSGAAVARDAANLVRLEVPIDRNHRRAGADRP